jgi:hypothetical protein
MEDTAGGIAAYLDLSMWGITSNMSSETEPRDLKYSKGLYSAQEKIL